MFQRQVPTSVKSCEQHVFFDIGDVEVADHIGGGVVLEYKITKLVCNECGMESSLKPVNPSLPK